MGLFPKRRRQRLLPRRAGLHAWETLGHGKTGLESLESRVLMAADLSVTIDDAHVYYSPGMQTTYTVTVTNLSTTETATDATVTSVLAGQITQKTWTAAFSSGSSGTASGAGDLNSKVTLAPGGTATFSVVSTIAANATGDLVSTATVTLAGDPDAANDTAVDTDQFVPKVIVLTDDIGRTSTSLVRVVDPDTGAVVKSFSAFEPGYNGGVQAVLGDFDGDGRLEIAAAPGRGRLGEVRFFTTDGARLTAFDTTPFGPSWKGGVNLAAGDVDGDGRDDLITAQASGAGEVRIFRSVAAADPIENTPYRTIHPFGPAYYGGSTVAAADMGTFTNGAITDAGRQDGKAEVLVGNGPTVAPSVRIYDVSNPTPAVVDTIRPFSAGQRGGVAVTVARVNADSIPDIIVTNGRSGRPVTEIYDGRTGASANALLFRYEAFGGLGRSNAAAFAAAIDTNGDGLADTLYGSQGYGGAAGVKILSTSGVPTGSLGSFAGPERIAAPSAATNPAIVTTASGLQYRDLVVGTGAVAAMGKTIEAEYRGIFLRNGAGQAILKKSGFPDKTGTLVSVSAGDVFQSGTLPATPLTTAKLIGGWVEGIAGMQVGGVRQLIIPAAQAYGVNGSGDYVSGVTSIPPNADLVFEVKLTSTT